jgi:hypothetical protein
MTKPPFRIIRFQGAFAIEDASGRRFGYVYFDNEPGRRNAAGLWTEAEALDIVQRHARMETDRPRFAHD